MLNRLASVAGPASRPHVDSDLFAPPQSLSVEEGAIGAGVSDPRASVLPPQDGAVGRGDELVVSQSNLRVLRKEVTSCDVSLYFVVTGKLCSRTLSATDGDGPSHQRYPLAFLLCPFALVGDQQPPRLLQILHAHLAVWPKSQLVWGRGKSPPLRSFQT